ncbi:MAG: S-layer homology domain-containing protein [Peptococcaceae bacterium]|nr:S-layer homology domain-containing protein [Peptococcaceae bacterium]
MKRNATKKLLSLFLVVLMLTSLLPITALAEAEPENPAAVQTEGSPDILMGEGTPGTPEEEGTPGAPEEEGTPGAPGQEETPGAPEEEGTPGAPGQEETPGAPGQEETPGTPEEKNSLPDDPAAGALPQGEELPVSLLASAGNLAISTREALADFAAEVNGGNSFEGYTITLEANIDLGGEITPWQPVGESGNPFKGTFDGGNHVISGLYIDAAVSNQGLFGYVDTAAAVKNLTVAGSVTSSLNYAAGIAGYSEGIIENCHNKVNVTGTEASAYYYGGIAGYNGGTIRNCLNTGSIVKEDSGTAGCGGIVGRLYGGRVGSCYNAGRVTGNGNFVGGIAGLQQSTSTVENCYNIGEVTNLDPSAITGAVSTFHSSAASKAIAANVYFLSGAGLAGVGNDSNNRARADEKTSEEMKTEVFLTSLNGEGSAFIADETRINSGYPVFAWQKEVDAGTPEAPEFQEATPFSARLAGYIRASFNGTKARLGGDSILAGFTESGTGTDWTAFAMGRFGYHDEAGSYHYLYEDSGYPAFLSALESYVEAKEGRLDQRKSTEWHRITYAILALGGNPKSFGGYDLIADGVYNCVTNGGNIGWQGINGYIFGLLALDTMRYEVPAGALNSREDLIRGILSLQVPDGVNGNAYGGWALSGNSSDPDISAMALQALAPYYFDDTVYSYTNTKKNEALEKTVGQAVDEALDKLGNLQRADGDYASWGTVNAESTAQVLVALTALGIDPQEDARFIKDGKSLLDGVLKYRVSDGTFSHVAGDGSNGMATDQCTYALVSYWRLANGLRALYDFRQNITAEEQGKITGANTAIAQIPAPDSPAYKARVKGAYTAFRQVAPGERRYVGKYPALAAAIELVGGVEALDSDEAFVTGISVTTPPDKTEYQEEESFDPAGMVVTAVYSDSHEGVLAPGEYAVFAPEFLALTDTAVTVKYKSLTAEVPITVTEKPYWEGAGTLKFPYLISNPESLKKLYTFVNVKGESTAGLYFKMTEDIDLSSEGQVSWSPIGSSSKPFQGTFDGGGFYIKNLYITGTGSYQGLFGYAGDSATIKNVVIASGSLSVGGFSGALLGWSAGADILNCGNRASVTVGGYSGYSGGLIGTVRDSGTTGVISGCYNSGRVDGGTLDPIGGLIGHIDGRTSVTVSNCYNTGEVIGAVDEFSAVGGIIGQSQNGLTSLQNCYNAGAVTGTGAIAGQVTKPEIFSNVYYLSGTHGVGIPEEDDPAEAKTEDEMKSAAFVTGLNGAGSAYVHNQLSFNQGYPLLAWQTAPSSDASVKQILMGEYAAEKTGNTAYRIGLPKNQWTLHGVSVTPNSARAAVSLAVPNGDYSAWTFQVTAEDGTLISYTLTVFELKAASAITFDADGGTVNGQAGITLTYDEDTADKSFPVPVKSGYTFLGWSDGTKIYSEYAADMPAALTLKAGWQKNGSGGPADDKIRVTFRLIGATLSSEDVDIGAGVNDSQYVTWIATRSYTMNKGDKVYDLFIKATSDAGLSSVGAENNYVETITAPQILGGYRLSEFTNGVYSGWMYTINGSHPGYGLKEQEIAEGNEVIWHYVNDYRYEVHDWFDDPEYPALGDGSDWSKWLEVPDVDPTGLPGGGGSGKETSYTGKTVSSAKVPEKVTADSKGSATASIDTKKLEEALNKAVENARQDDLTPEVKVTVEIKGEATSLDTKLQAKAIQELAKTNNAQLTIESGLGAVSFDNATLKGMAGGTSGSESIVIGLAKVEPDTLPEAARAVVGKSLVFDLTVKVADEAIHQFDGTATIFFPYSPEDGADPAEMQVFHLGDDGVLQQMKNVRYDKTRKGFVFETTHFSLFFIGKAETAWPFTDVKEGDWFYGPVKYAYEKGLMTKTSATTFSPGQNMTRAMLVSVLHRLEGKPVVNAANPFTDVKAGDWYADAVIWANAGGIVTGYGNGLFGTNDPVTRQQMAAILYQYAKSKGYDVTKTADLGKYADASSVSAWAQEPMKWAVTQGLITGMTKAALAPAGFATRGQVAAILMRFAEALNES